MGSYEEDPLSSSSSSSVANPQGNSSDGNFHPKDFQAGLDSLDHELSKLPDDELDELEMPRHTRSSASEESSSDYENMKASDITGVRPFATSERSQSC